MNCDRCSMLLELREDGALSAEDARAVEAHLAGCEACRLEVEEIAATDRAFRMMATCDPPVDIAAAVRAQIARETPAESHNWLAWSLIVMGLLAFAALATGFVTAPAFLVEWTQAPVVVAAWRAALGGAYAAGQWLSPLLIPLRAVLIVLATLAPLLLPLMLLQLLAGAWIFKMRSGGTQQTEGA